MSKPVIFIDTEFNGSKLDGYGGELISMALIEGDNKFYEVIELKDDIIIDPWVKENVMPVLNKNPISYIDFQGRLENFLCKLFYPYGFILVSDWPDDIRYFCDSLIINPGIAIDIYSFEMKVIFSLSSEFSKIPHNALEDAKAIKESFLMENRWEIIQKTQNAPNP